MLEQENMMGNVRRTESALNKGLMVPGDPEMADAMQLYQVSQQ